MSVTKDTVGTDTTGTGPTLDHTGSTVGAGSNRAMLALVVFVDDSAGATSLTATWDQGGTNQSMTEIGRVSPPDSANVYAVLFGLINPVSGNKTLRAVYSGTGTSLQITAGVVSFANVDQTSVAVAFPHSTSNNGTASGAQGVTVTSASGNYTASLYANTGSSSNITGNNQTQEWFDTSGAISNVLAQSATGAATVSHTVTMTATDNWGVIGVDVLASGGGLTTAQEVPAFVQELSGGGMIGRVDA